MQVGNSPPTLPNERRRQPNASKADNRENKVACQIINAMFLFMIMLQIRGEILIGILEYRI